MILPGQGETVTLMIRRLRELGQEMPDLKEVAQFYEIILPLLHDVDLQVAPLRLSLAQARTSMEKERPILSDAGIELDGLAVCELMHRLAHAVETGVMISGHQGPYNAEARRIRCALEEERLDTFALMHHIAAGEKAPVIAMAQGQQLDAGLLGMLAQTALKPALRAVCCEVIPLLEGVSWSKGICFVCGAPATLGELRNNNLTKHLRCGQCGADWHYRRQQCAHCGNEDHRTLGFLYAEDHLETRRVEVCNNCRGYLKVITSFCPTPPEMLIVEDLATLHLDYIAQNRGYIRRDVQYSAQLL